MNTFKLAHDYRAVVLDVYDGDTFTVDIDLGFGVWLRNQKIRLYGVNTPEIRTKDKQEKIKGYKVRDYIRTQLLDKVVILRTYKKNKGKFGRWLCTIFYKEKGIIKNLGVDLIDKKLADSFMLDPNDNFMFADTILNKHGELE